MGAAPGDVLHFIAGLCCYSQKAQKTSKKKKGRKEKKKKRNTIGEWLEILEGNIYMYVLVCFCMVVRCGVA